MCGVTGSVIFFLHVYIQDWSFKVHPEDEGQMKL